jgi:hypothetical protein
LRRLFDRLLEYLDGEDVERIYVQGIETGQATFKLNPLLGRIGIRGIYLV